MQLRAIMVFITVSGAWPAAGFAQSDAMQMAQVSSANELGVLEYCRDHGWTDQAAVDAQTANISKLPAAGDQAAVGSAESAGKDGRFMANGTQHSLSEMAASKNSSEQAMCGQMGDAVKSVAARMASVPGGMPTMQNGVTMPAMPNGLSMPTMPNMPNVPGSGAVPQMPVPQK